MRILGIESASLVASVAIVTDDVITADYTVNLKKTHSLSYPTASICPCCLPLSIEPAPLISRSRNAILKPEPNCVNSLIASSLFAATSVSTLPRLKVKYAKARRFDLPTRPRS